MQIFSTIKSINVEFYNTIIVNVLKLLITMKRPLSIDEITRFTKFPISDIEKTAHLFQNIFPMKINNTNTNMSTSSSNRNSTSHNTNTNNSYSTQQNEPLIAETTYLTPAHISIIEWLTDSKKSGDLKTSDKNKRNSFFIDKQRSNQYFTNLLKQQMFKTTNETTTSNTTSTTTNTTDSEKMGLISHEKDSYLVDYLLDHLDTLDGESEAKQMLLSLPSLSKTFEKKGLGEL